MTTPTLSLAEPDGRATPIPAELRRDLRAGDHAHVRLRLRSVFAPVPAGPAAFVLGFAWFNVLFWIAVGWALRGLLGDLDPFVTTYLAMIPVATSLAALRLGRAPTLEVTLGQHRLQIGRWFSVRLADIARARVCSGEIAILLRSGHIERFALPERSSQTFRALDRLLGSAERRGRAAAAGHVPEELAALVRAAGTTERG